MDRSPIANLTAEALCPEPALVVPGDVAADVDDPRNILVRGGVSDMAKLAGGGTIVVEKAIDAAIVQCAADLVVAGGILGKEKGACTAGRDIRARYASNASLDAGRDILVNAQLSNSVVRCGGRLIVRGAIIAGRAVAVGGIACQSLGSGAGVATLVAAGIDEAFDAGAADAIGRIEEALKQADKVRATVEPLLRNQKQLSPAQKEQATELLYSAADARERAMRQLQAMKQQFEGIQARARAVVCVSELVHPGVTIRFPGVEATVAFPLQGPLDIAPRRRPGQLTIVAVQPGTRAEMMLEAHALPEPAADAVQRLLACTPPRAVA